jgi:hypothetical protein
MRAGREVIRGDWTIPARRMTIGEATESLLSTSAASGYASAATGPNSFRLARSRRPRWATSAAIAGSVLFGLGLLLLLVRETETADAFIVEERDGVKLRMSGTLAASALAAFQEQCGGGSRTETHPDLVRVPNVVAPFAGPAQMQQMEWFARQQSVSDELPAPARFIADDTVHRAEFARPTSDALQPVPQAEVASDDTVHRGGFVPPAVAQRSPNLALAPPQVVGTVGALAPPSVAAPVMAPFASPPVARPPVASPPVASPPVTTPPLSTAPRSPASTAGSAIPGAKEYMMRFATGAQVKLAVGAVIGRNPQDDPEVPGATRIVIDDMSLSRTHLTVGLDADGVWVVDRNSTNGVTVRLGSTEFVCTPGDRVDVPPGAVVSFGDRAFTVAVA